MSFRALSFSYRISHCAILNKVYETCLAIWQCFCSTHMSLPTIEEWKNIALDFYNKWNFPNCIGCIDGKHIRIICPKKTGSTFFNYKSYFSIVLQGIADANYKFIAVEVGAYGRQSDGGTLLSRARPYVECAFGILVAKWRCLKTELQIAPDKVDIIVKCVCLLHNIIIDMEGLSSLNIPAMGLEAEHNPVSRRYNNYGRSANDAREAFKTYFVSPAGKVPFQYNLI
nr:unnamed protein product [Callosobruchus analis]